MLKDIFLLPVKDNVLLHAPLHGVSAVINRSGAFDLQEINDGTSQNLSTEFQALRELLDDHIPPPIPRKGILNNPRFLGLIVSHKCNMLCRYCHFTFSKNDTQTMSVKTCKNAIDTYFTLLRKYQHTQAAIHFFGGEPFFHPDLMFFAVEYALFRSSQYNLSLHLEATTNGLIDPLFADWVSEMINCVVLSLDGNEEIQVLQRPTNNSIVDFDTIVNAAKTIANGSCNLIIRSCVTQESLPMLINNVRWIANEFCPETICLEPMSQPYSSEKINLQPPDPIKFAKNFLMAELEMNKKGINVMLSTADLSLTTVSSCPVGHDALIVSPNGEINACYLPKDIWLKKGKKMELGTLENRTFSIPQSNLEEVRQNQVGSKSLCKNCFVRYHCAGGCHVNHEASLAPGNYDNLCVRTRLISIGKLLIKISQFDLLKDWLFDEQALQISAYWPNDHDRAWPK